MEDNYRSNSNSRSSSTMLGTIPVLDDYTDYYD